MSRFRPVVRVVGYVLFGASFTVLVAGMLLGVDSVPAVLTGELLPAAFFTVATMATTLAVILSGMPEGKATPLEVEAVNGGRVFGVRFDRRLTRWLLVVPEDERGKIREELRETALQTLVRTTDCTRETAREKLETGNWTNDRIAASFFEPTGKGWQSRTRAIVGRVRFEHRVERTVRALQTIESKNE